MLKTNTNIVNYMACMRTINTDGDVTLLCSDKYRGLFTIGADKTLYAYHESSGCGAQFKRQELYKNCDAFAGVRMGDTQYFALAIISNNTVYTCVSNEPEKIKPESFGKLDFAGVLQGRRLIPRRLFIHSNDKEVAMAVMMQNEGGRIEQFIAYFNIKSPTVYEYYPLAAGFDTIKNSVCGRAKGQPVDGVYTFGRYGNSDQLLYTPIKNIFSTEPPNPIRLGIPGTGIDCTGICRLNYATGTHLIAIGRKCLYLYPYEKQFDCMHIEYNNYEKIAESDYFAEAVKISSYIDADNGKLYIWVLNRAGKLSYTFAKITPDGKYGEFALPVVYKNGVSYFDAAKDTLVICQNSEVLFGSLNNEGGYTFEHVSIDTDSGKYINFHAFSTKLMTDKPSQSVRLQSDVPVEAYINDIYYRFTDVIVESDANGVLDIIQNAEDLSPKPFYISTVVDGVASEEKTEFFAGREIHDKLLGLNTAQSLKAAKIKDMHGRETDLTSGLSNERINLAAQAIGGLSSNYKVMMQRYDNALVFGADRNLCVGGFFDDIGHYLSEAWDYVCEKTKDLWDKTIGKVVSFAVDIAKDVIRFIIKIGEEIITVLLDTVGKVLKCAVKVLEFIGIPVHKILDWLKSFLDIDGAIRTKEMMKYCAERGIGQIKDCALHSRDYIVKKLDEALASIEKWAEIDTRAAISSEKPQMPFELNASNMYMFDIIFKRGDLLAVTLPASAPPAAVNAAADKIKSLIEAYNLGDVKNDILNVVNDIEKISENLTDFVTFLRRLIGLIGAEVLNAVKLITDAVFDLVVAAADWLWKLINTNIHIPFISAVFEFFGIKDFSLLDAMCMVPAFLANLIYHAVYGSSLVGENDLEELKKMEPGQLFADIVQNGVGVEELEALGASAEWDNDAYNLEKMSKLELPSGAKRNGALALRFILMGIYTVNTIYHSISTYTDGKNSHKVHCEGEITPDSPLNGHLVDIVLTVLAYGCSVQSGYVCYAPMDYDSDTPTHMFNTLFHINAMAAICLNAFSIYADSKTPVKMTCASESNGLEAGEAGKSGWETADFVFNIIMIVLEGLSLCCEIASAAMAGELDLSRQEIEHEGVTYKMNTELLKKDRKIFLADVSSYIFNDTAAIMDGIMGLVGAEKCSGTALVIYTICRALVGVGSVASSAVAWGILI